MLQLRVDPYTTRTLGLRDVAELQDLYERCSDFHEVEQGVPTLPDAAERLLSTVPEGKDEADKLVLGVRSGDGRLVGVLDLIRDLPAEGEWWLGLLMLDPAERRRGLGAALVKALANAIRDVGGGAVSLGVLEQNTAAGRFWERLGFVELRRSAYEARSGRRSRVIVMRRLLN